MAKKLTDEDVRMIAESRGFTVLTKHVNNSETMSFLCQNGHIWDVGWQHFRKYDCKHCLKEIENKCFLDEAINIIDSAGGKHVSGEYTKKESRIKFSCVCGEEGNLMLVELRRSKGHCPNCRYKRSSDTLSLSFEHVRSIFEDNGCELVSENYINNHIPLAFICYCGNKDEKSLVRFKECPKCSVCVGREFVSPIRPKTTLEEAIKEYGDAGCKFVGFEGEYKGLQTRTTYICRCGRPHTSTISQFKDSLRCRQCGIEERANKTRYTIDEVRKLVKENSNCILVSSFFNKATDYLEFICFCGKPFETTFSNFIHENKRQCNDCGIATRSGEYAPRWNGGITSEIQKLRHSKEYFKWRSIIYERDNYTCQCCLDDSGGNLQAHHIENFSTHEDLRFDDLNGLTLCSTCHDFRYNGSFHHTYGTKYNNREQLIEYITNKRKELGISAELPFLLL